jgi:protein TonB
MLRVHSPGGLVSHVQCVRSAGFAIALLLAACSEGEAKSESAGASAAGAVAAPAAAGTPADASTLIAAARDYAGSGCSAARRRLETCAACEAPEQKPLRDLLLAYCAERDSPADARALYEAIITSYPNTEASVTAIMRVRQIDAAELPPPGEASAAKPKAIERPGPAYPTLAEAAGIEGKVRLRFDVRGDGGVANARVLESTPPLIFDAVALYAVSEWKYEPGAPAEAQQVVLRFDLPDAAAAEPAR